MFKKVLAFLAAMYMAVSFAAVDVNKATAAELDGIKGIGPGISGKIIDERKKGNFKDWNDFIERVKGVGEANAAKYSAQGMTVGGASFKGVAAAPAAKEEKKDSKAEAKMKADEAKTKKEAEKKAKAEEKKKMAAEAKAKADAEKAAKADAAKKAMDAKKSDKPAAKADAAKPAASAPKK